MVDTGCKLDSRRGKRDIRARGYGLNVQYEQVSNSMSGLHLWVNVIYIVRLEVSHIACVTVSMIVGMVNTGWKLDSSRGERDIRAWGHGLNVQYYQVSSSMSGLHLWVNVIYIVRLEVSHTSRFLWLPWASAKLVLPGKTRSTVM